MPGMDRLNRLEFPHHRNISLPLMTAITGRHSLLPVFDGFASTPLPRRLGEFSIKERVSVLDVRLDLFRGFFHAVGCQSHVSAAG